MRIGTVAGIAVCLLCLPAIQGCAGLAAAATGTAVGAVAADNRRTPGSYLDDELIELRVEDAIAEDEILKRQTHVNVTSYNGLVLLTGEAPGESLRTRITELTRDTPKVRGVQNEVALMVPSTLVERATDSVVTGKVKASLYADRTLNAGRIKVVTERGVVYLMGLLTDDEVDRAADIARRVAGVQRVVKFAERIQ